MFETIKRLNDDIYKFPSRCLPSYYFDSFNLLHKYENALRLFVYVTLKACHGANWDSLNLPGKDRGTISSAYKKQIGQLQALGHIGSLPNIPLLYLSLDDLTGLLDNDSVKAFIKPYFPASLEKVYIPKLCEVKIIRNNIVHFRDFKEKDFQRLMFNLEDIWSPVSRLLSEIISSDQYVGPSENDRWYQPWASIRDKETKQSIIRVWLVGYKTWIRLGFSAETMESKDRDSEYMNIDFNRVVDKLRKIFPYLIYFQKSLWPSRHAKDGGGRSFSLTEKSAKDIRILFYEKQFENNSEQILTVIDDVMSNPGNYIGAEPDDYTWEDARNIPYIDTVEDWTYFWSPTSLNTFQSPWLKREIPR